MWKLDKRYSLYSGLNFSKQRRKKNNEKIDKNIVIDIICFDTFKRVFCGNTNSNFELYKIEEAEKQDKDELLNKI